MERDCMNNANIVRTELKKMDKKDLSELTWQREKRWCNVGACECAFFVEYKDFNFCLTELLGQGCSPELDPGGRPDEFQPPAARA